MSSSTSTTKIAQQIFSKQTLKYVFTTHFWGPVSNFGLPLAAIADIRNKSPELISGPMTASLVVYSMVFMRYAMAVKPANYLLFGCHLLNEVAQLTQGYRYLQYNYLNKEQK